MRFRATCYRAHDPKWAFSPLSGDGAKAYGGRFNPVGMPVLYLALTVQGMFVEMGFGFARRFDPLTVCAYDVDVEDIIDLTIEQSRRQEHVELAEMACIWEEEFANGREPASWRIGQRLVTQGASGMLAPSFATGARAGMTNLVLWNWGPDMPHRVVVHDPAGRLPKARRPGANRWPRRSAATGRRRGYPGPSRSGSSWAANAVGGSTRWRGAGRGPPAR